MTPLLHRPPAHAPSTRPSSRPSTDGRPIRRRARSDRVLSDVGRPAVRHRAARRRARRRRRRSRGRRRSRTSSRRAWRRARSCTARSTGRAASITCSSTPGQHVLSAAFDRLHRRPHGQLSSRRRDARRSIWRARSRRRRSTAAEPRRISVVWEDRPVTIRFATRRGGRAGCRCARSRRGPGRCGSSRSPDFDLSACGGTHVPAHGHDRHHRGHGLGAVQGRDARLVRVRRPRAGVARGCSATS